MSSGTRVQDRVETEEPMVPKAQINRQKKKSKDPKEKPNCSTEKPKGPTALCKLFRYATKIDIFLMVIGTLTSMVNGVIFPIFFLVLGDFTDDISPTNFQDSYAEAAKNNAIKFIIVGGAAFVANLFTYWCWVTTGARQTKRYRDEYFKAMLRQPISYFDASNPNEFASRMASETDLIEKGLSEKMTEITSGIASIVSGLAVGYANGRELSSLLLAAIFVVGITAVLFAVARKKETTQSVEAYSKSGGSAEQALGAMRTVASLTGEPKELTAYKMGAKAVTRAMRWLIVQSSFAYAMFVGAHRSTDEELWEALRKANAEEFVRAFKDGLNTHVGSSGTTISGGQKQRIAIARIILKNPSILLLDEATSALDRKNEHEIQKTLDDIAEGRTSIVIAHRLTTIQNADCIFVFDKGIIVEQGTHEELIQQENVYYHLQKGQISNKKDEKQKPVALGDNQI